MVEKVLLLLSDHALADALVPLLKRWGINCVDLVFGPSLLRLGKLAQCYTTVVIDTRFAGREKDTAKLVRRIRRNFYHPMIGIRSNNNSDSVFVLQVAGCNFGIDPFMSRHFTCPAAYDVAVHAELCELLGKIEPVLERQEKLL